MLINPDIEIPKKSAYIPSNIFDNIIKLKQ